MNQSGVTTTEVGFVTSVRGFLVYLNGLPSIKLGEVVESENGALGWVSLVSEGSVEVVLTNLVVVRPGDLFKRVSKPLSLKVSEECLGRIIDPLGNARDGRKLSHSNPVEMNLEESAPPLSERKFITDQFVTGFTTIDSLIPLGKGQRELILGDAHSGKTFFITDLIGNVKDPNVICIYASIGKSAVEVRHMVDILTEREAMSNTILICAYSTDTPPLLFLTPFSAFSVAEYFQRQGKDVLVILDDLGTHAKMYREMGLLAQKNPGREAYPGDIFYQHAHLLERAGSFQPSIGGGSITALPIIELNLLDYTSYIPTNLMSMTDGHLLFSARLYNKGISPAVDLFTSVSRAGRQTQPYILNTLSDRIRLILTQATQVEDLSRFSSELSRETQTLIYRKQIIKQILNQEGQSVDLPIQVVLLGLVFTTFYSDHPSQLFTDYRKTLTACLKITPSAQNFLAKVLQFKDFETFLSELQALTPEINNYFSRVVKEGTNGQS